MGFLDFIKSKLFRKQEMLPEPVNIARANSTKSNNVKANSANVNRANVNGANFNKSVKVDYTPQPKSLEYALEQYISGILFQRENSQNFNSYSALTSLAGIDTSNPGNNLQNEQNLVSKIKKYRKDINLINQPTANGGVCFRHIQHGRNASNTDTRLYINCKRENIAELADKFIEEFGDSDYYFKFCTDEQASSKRRSEQFVFYLSSEPKEINRVIQTIERTKQKHPRLFSGSRNMNPFMKDINGYIGCAPDVKEGIFHSLNGEKRPINKSYNTLLSEALTDSFVHSIRDVVASDYNLTLKTGGKVFEAATPYFQTVLKDVYNNPEYKKKLIDGMKFNLEKISQKNPELDVRGIRTQKEVQQEKI